MPRPNSLKQCVYAVFNALFPVGREPLEVRAILKAPQPTQPPSPSPGFLIGKCLRTGRAMCASNEELDRHILLVGATGCGKTTLICRFFDEEVQKWQ